MTGVQTCALPISTTQTAVNHPQESSNQRPAELTNLVVEYSPDGTKIVRRLSIPDDASSDATEIGRASCRERV